MGKPAIISPVNAELLKLMPPLAVAVLSASAWIAEAEIRPPSRLKFFTSELAATWLLVVVLLVVMVEATVPELTNEPRLVRLAALDTVVGTGLQARPTDANGPTVPVFEWPVDVE